jgi:coenzyme PQQ precursor peptide PqqA
MQRIGPRLIYKISSIGLDRKASHRRPQWARKEESMAWTTPTLVEICIGLEINGYLPAEF